MFGKQALAGYLVSAVQTGVTNGINSTDLSGFSKDLLGGANDLGKIAGNAARGVIDYTTTGQGIKAPMYRL